MNVLYDHQIFSSQQFGGISRYFYELMNNSERLYNFKASILFSDNEYLKAMTTLSKFPIKKYSAGGKKIMSKLNQIYSDIQISKNIHDILHPTYYNPYILKHNRKPIVLTVYDMIHELFPEYMSFDKNIIPNKLELMNNANVIIAISNSTKNDILKLYPAIPENKIHVVYLGSSLKQSDSSEQNECPYLLFTGQRGLYKNFANFIYAVSPLLKKYNLELKCTGTAFCDHELELLSNEGIFDRVTCSFNDDCELSDLYAKALAFIFPSKYEGFGIPILEAFGSNCPVVLSNTSSLPEIGGNAALYFDPDNIEDMRCQIDKVISSKSLRDKMRTEGLCQYNKFSWKKCAEDTFSLYQSIL